MTKFSAILLLSTALLTLSACKTLDGLVDDVDSLDIPSALSMHESTPDGLTYDGNCPRVEVVPELRSYSDFADDGSTRPEALVSRAMISNVQTSCSLDKNSVTVDLKTTFSGTLGPQGRGAAADKPFFSYPFFVAVAAAGGKILTKEIYAASITYPPGRNSHSYNENMRFILPMETRDQGRNQKILLGFQLSPDQLAFNRKQIKAEKEAAERQAELDKKNKELLEKQQKALQKSTSGSDSLIPPQNLVIDAEPLAPPKK